MNLDQLDDIPLDEMDYDTLTAYCEEATGLPCPPPDAAADQANQWFVAQVFMIFQNYYGDFEKAGPAALNYFSEYADGDEFKPYIELVIGPGRIN